MEWDGEITPEIRRKIREKRLQLRTTCQSIAAVLGLER
jgi:hypothetical protein